MFDLVHSSLVATLRRRGRNGVKGIIFNLLEDFLKENLGEEKFEELIESCSLKTREPFVGPGSYPDEDLLAIVDRAVEVTGMTKAAALRAFGKFCIGKFTLKYPLFFSKHSNAKSFLKTLNALHEIEVKKLYADAKPPEFVMEDPSPDRLVMRYVSERKLCLLAEGLIEGVAEHYRSPIRFRQTQCMLEGGSSCEFELEFAPAGVVAK
jgi:predicted hydrocarbon binding protein